MDTVLPPSTSLKRMFFAMGLIWLQILGWSLDATTYGTAVSADQRKKLSTLLSQHSQGARIEFERISTIGLLDSREKAEGRLELSRGYLRVELRGDENSTLVITPEKATLLVQPHRDFPNARPQVFYGGNRQENRNNPFYRLLASNKPLNDFFFTGIKDEDTEKIFYLEPKQNTSNVERLLVVTNKDISRLLRLKYWDESRNTIEFVLKNIRVNQEIDRSRFQLKVPDNAEIIR